VYSLLDIGTIERSGGIEGVFEGWVRNKQWKRTCEEYTWRVASVSGTAGVMCMPLESINGNVGLVFVFQFSACEVETASNIPKMQWISNTWSLPYAAFSDHPVISRLTCSRFSIPVNKLYKIHHSLYYGLPCLTISAICGKQGLVSSNRSLLCKFQGSLVEQRPPLP